MVNHLLRLTVIIQGSLCRGSYGWNPFLFELSGRTDDNEQYGRHNTWSAASGLDIDENHHLRLSYGTAFKAPPLWIFTLHTPQKATISSQKRARILSWAYPAAIAPGIGQQIFIATTSIQNLIQCHGPDYRPYNIGEVRLEGVELAIGLDTWLVHHDKVVTIHPRSG
ncbi:TonB-dependent receptor domain-containing protein [Aeromonas hydrophila]|uniref:TonB-dependent receptor domain-containing protein n=1 Tax=Aeromonas hydrophila TaxID=644 RepID=UPI003F7A12AA